MVVVADFEVVMMMMMVVVLVRITPCEPGCAGVSLLSLMPRKSLTGRARLKNTRTHARTHARLKNKRMLNENLGIGIYLNDEIT